MDVWDRKRIVDRAGETMETEIFVINREIVPFSRRCNALGQVMNQGKV